MFHKNLFIKQIPKWITLSVSELETKLNMYQKSVSITKAFQTPGKTNKQNKKAIKSHKAIFT